MTRLTWGSFGTREFHIGVSHGVFFDHNGEGKAWTGLTSVTQTEESYGDEVVYVDGHPYRAGKALGDFKADVSAFSYPEELEQYENLQTAIFGSPLKTFSFSYRTELGNEVTSDSFGYQIHLVYNAIASPTNADYKSGENLDPIEFSWSISATPIDIPDASPSAHIILDSTLSTPETMRAVEDLIYGSPTTESKLPTISELMVAVESGATLLVVDHGDGTFSIIGPDSAIEMLDESTFQVSWPSVEILDSDTYKISSL